MIPRFNLFLLFVLSLSGYSGIAQMTSVKGKVTDAGSGKALPFVSVSFPGVPGGVYSDEHGNYLLTTDTPADSVAFSYFGYKPVKKPVKKGLVQEINVALQAQATTLKAIVVTNKEDPAYAVVRKAVKEKDKYNKEKLNAYEFQSQTRIFASFDKIPKKLKKNKIGQELTTLLDSLKSDKDSTSLPFFASEAISRYYHRNNPEKATEHILATKVSGVFVDDGSFISQIIGSSFQNYNFDKNWVNIVQKDFISPIADGAMGFYEYQMLDTLTNDSLPVYEIRITPKRKQDLAFSGKIWIQESTYALTRIEAEIGKQANLNFISHIKINQELQPTVAGAWLPNYTEVGITFSGLSENWAGLQTDFKSFNSDFKVNLPKDPKFYDTPIVVESDASAKDTLFWEKNTTNPLTEEERGVFALIDSVKHLPTVKTYVEILDIAVNGYFDAGKIDIGPYLYAFAWNKVEGCRFRAGFRTNADFSKKWIFKGYLAYGTKDAKFKYKGNASYIFDRKQWTQLGIDYKYDIDQVALPEDKLDDNNNLFLAFTKWGTLVGPTYNTSLSVNFFRQFSKDFSQRILLQRKNYSPIFPYAFYPNGSNKPTDIIKTSEVSLESRYAKDEIMVINDNQRISLGTKSWPVFKLKYTLGLPSLFNSNTQYQKLDLSISDNFKLGSLGRSYYDFTAGKIFGAVPLPLLEVFVGNESPFYTTAGFNLMNYFEFVNDEFVTLKYRHYFEGLLLNRIPLIKKLKWRTLVSASIAYGGLSNANKMLSAPFDASGNPTLPFSSLGNKPYVELGYGIENIFKVFRVDFFHRITYLDNPGIRHFGVKFSAQFSL